MLLADMGAEVIKVESPGGGDAVRGQGDHQRRHELVFCPVQSEQESVTLDLYTDEGKDQLASLVEGADILVENFRPGVLSKMGFGKERLDALNPELIVASVNGIRVDRPLCGPAVVRFHCSGDERLHERHR